MFDKIVGFFVLCLVSSCSNGTSELDSPKDKREVLASQKGKMFGDLNFPLSDNKKKEETKK